MATTSATGQATPPNEDPGSPENLERGLSNRHIQLIAIGGAIGTGLFLGSGKTISVAGPSVIFVYMIIGFMLYFVMRAMGEILLSNLGYRTFADFAGDLIGPWAGFMVGWTYWICWITIGIADLVAITGYVADIGPTYKDFVSNDATRWIPAALAILVFLILNLVAVKLFGEMEFWFALIKIVAIIALILVGAFLVITAFQAPAGYTASLENLWNDRGMFPHGFVGFLGGFQIAIFAFQGIELAGTAAAEAKNPEKNLPRAINSIPIRVLLFYVVSLVAIMAVTPWRFASKDKSPFIEMFQLIGFAGAALAITLVVISSAASSANSGIYSTSRIMYGMASDGEAPKFFAKLSQQKVPARALMLSCLMLVPGIILLYAGDSVGNAFTFVTSVSAILFITVWGFIVISYLAFRAKRPELHTASKFKMPGGKFMAWVVLVFFAAVIVVLAYFEDTRIAVFVAPAWYLILTACYFVFIRPAVQKRQAAEKITSQS